MRYSEIVKQRDSNGWWLRHPDGHASPKDVRGKIVGRVIDCTRCQLPSDVIEAQSSTLGPHQHVDPRTWVCLPCIEHAIAEKHERQAA